MKSLLGILLTFLSLWTFAQAPLGHKQEEKAIAFEEKGAYKKALNQYNKALRIADSQDTVHGERFYELKLQKANVLAPLGLMNQFHFNDVNNALAKLDSIYGDDNDSKVAAWTSAIRFYNSIGYYKKSLELELRIAQSFQPESEADSLLFFRGELEKVRRNIGLGNYNLAQTAIDQLTPKLRKRNTSKDKVLDQETGELVERKLTDLEQSTRKAQYVEAKLWQTKLWQGIEVEKLDTLSLNSFNWFKKNSSGGGVTGTSARYLGDLYYSKGDFSSAKHWYKKAIKYFKKDFHSSHPQVLDGYARLVDVLIAKNDEKQIEIHFNKMQSKLSYYDKEYSEIQPAFLHASIATYDYKKLYSNAIYAAGLWRKETKKKGFIPTLSAFQANKDVYSYLIKRRRTALAGEFINNNREWSNTMFGPSLNLSANNLLWADYQMTYLMDLKNAKSVYFGEDWDRLSAELNGRHSLIRSGMTNRGKLFMLDNDFEQAEQAFSHSFHPQKEESEEAKINQAIITGELAKLYLTTGEYSKAKDTLNFAMAMVDDVLGKNSYEYAQLEQIEAQYYEYMGDLNRANALLKKATHQMNRLMRKQKVKTTTDGENLALMYLNSGQYNQAEKLLVQLVENRALEFGDASPTLIKPLYYNAKCMLFKGDFVSAESMTRKAMDLSSKNSGDQTLEYLMLQKQLSEVYFQMGDYPNSIILLEGVAETQKEVLGKSHLSLADTYTALSRALFFNDGEVKDARRKAKNAKQIVEKVVGNKHPIFADALINLALLEMEDEKYPLANTYFNQAQTIIEEQYGKNSLQMADLLQKRGDMELIRGKWNDAMGVLQKSASLYKGEFGKEHPEYQKIQTKQSRAELMLGRYNKALNRMTNVMDQDLEFVERYFAHLSEREKSKYWSQLKEDFDVYYYALFRSGKLSDKTLRTAMEHRMRSKGVLFRSTNEIQRAVAASRDTVLTTMFEDWKAQKELLSTLVSLTDEEIKERGYNLFRMERNINDLEKEISESINMPFTQSNVDVKDLIKGLQQDEVAIDVVRFSSPNVSGFDSAFYGYFVLTPEGISIMENPVSGNMLEREYTNYYRNATMLSTKDLYSYANLWQPIDELGLDGKRVYFSPDGTYNQINPEMFRVGSAYVFDKYAIEWMGNLSELGETYSETPLDTTRSYSVELVGNPLFYEDNEPRNVPHMVMDLPGAELEVQEINTMLSNKGWETHALLGADGTEEDVKRIEKADVVHFATHGYFTENDVVGNGIGLREKQAIQNPLYQSGLILKDGGMLVEGESLYINKKPGVLTAYEAMNMNLGGTELVVLSACETGRGQIELGEGVYGLQRALMNAGAEAVIMSLFKVSDEVTQEMMVSFYSYWSDGLSKEAAFRKAKHEIREKYPDPRLWGSFVMVKNRG